VTVSLSFCFGIPLFSGYVAAFINKTNPKDAAISAALGSLIPLSFISLLIGCLWAGLASFTAFRFVKRLNSVSQINQDASDESLPGKKAKSNKFIRFFWGGLKDVLFNTSLLILFVFTLFLVNREVINDLLKEAIQEFGTIAFTDYAYIRESGLQDYSGQAKSHEKEYILNSVVFSLPWSQLTRAGVTRDSVYLKFDNKKKGIVLRGPWDFSEWWEINDVTDWLMHKAIGSPKNHFEWQRAIYNTSPEDISPTSSVLSDVLTSINLIAKALYVPNGVEEVHRFRNDNTAGYVIISTFTSGFRLYELSESNGTSYFTMGINKMVIDDLRHFLRSIRIVHITENYGKEGYEDSRRMFEREQLDSEEKIACLLHAIEAISNSPKNLDYSLHLLEFYKRFNHLKDGKKFVSLVIEWFPDSKQQLKTQFPQFFQDTAVALD